MKLLLLHTDYIKFKPLKKALKNIEELSEKEKKGEFVEEALVVLTAVEKEDGDTKKIVEKLVTDVRSCKTSKREKNCALSICSSFK